MWFHLKGGLQLLRFLSKAVPAISIDEFAAERSRQIDRHILEKERSASLKFVSGTFRIAWASPKFRMSMELYYQDQEGHWQKEESSEEEPVESLTEDSRQLLEHQKDLNYPVERPEPDNKPQP